MVIAEKIRKIRDELESKKPMLALPPSSIEVVEITDAESPAFKKAMEIYTKSLPEEEREETANIARYVRRTQKTGKESPLGNSEFHLLAIKDNNIQGNETEKIIGQAQISYFPGKRWGALWYVSIDPNSRGSWRKLLEGTSHFRKQLEGYAAKNGEKPIGLFMDVEADKKSMLEMGSKNGYVFKDIEFDIPPVRKGGRSQRTSFVLIPYESVDLPGWALKDIMGDYMKIGFNIRHVESNAQYQKAARSVTDGLYRMQKKM